LLGSKWLRRSSHLTRSPPLLSSTAAASLIFAPSSVSHPMPGGGDQPEVRAAKASSSGATAATPRKVDFLSPEQRTREREKRIEELAVLSGELANAKGRVFLTSSERSTVALQATDVAAVKADVKKELDQLKSS